MKIKEQSSNVTKKMLINASGSRPFKELTDFVGVKAVAIAEDVNNETGELCDYGYIFSEDGIVYAGNSATMINGIRDIIDILNDGEAVEVRAIARQSNNGRTFYTVEVK